MQMGANLGILPQCCRHRHSGACQALEIVLLDRLHRQLGKTVLGVFMPMLGR
jgi:hypothetical protein